jgi:hypothetical protein
MQILSHETLAQFAFYVHVILHISVAARRLHPDILLSVLFAWRSWHCVRTGSECRHSELGMYRSKCLEYILAL